MWNASGRREKRSAANHDCLSTLMALTEGSKRSNLHKSFANVMSAGSRNP